MLAQTQAAEPDLHSKIHQRETSFFSFSSAQAIKYLQIAFKCIVACIFSAATLRQFVMLLRHDLGHVSR
jgi:hypothetical protein